MTKKAGPKRKTAAKKPATKKRRAKRQAKKSPAKRAASAPGAGSTEEETPYPKRKTAKKPAQRAERAKKATGDEAKEAKEARDACVVVGVGASAGGLEAYKQLLRSMPENPGVAFVLVQHLDPTHESLMVDLLSKYTTMPVIQVEDAASIKPNHVYMIPPNKFITIKGARLHLEQPIVKRGVRLPIDHFFRSLASARQERAICVVLTGTGSDGADGLREVKAEGGMTIVQNPDTAEYDGMPRAALSTEAVDFSVPIAEMADIILPYAAHPYVQARSDRTLAESAPDHFRAILSLLRAHTDHDFTNYKPGTLTRRIDRRMSLRQIAKPSAYLKLLREENDELRALFKDLLIGVTRFRRDPEAWNFLDDEVGKALEEKSDGDAFRVWVPGCSTGEEAYSIAMLLYERQKRLSNHVDVQVFATDIDMDAVDVARTGVYPENVVKDLPDGWVDSYFHREGEKLRVRKKLRESCIFAVQNLLTDPPFSNLDLITCRNVLIYLEPQIQRGVFRLMHFALKPQGLLFLGSSESPSKVKPLFSTVSQSARVYRKVGKSKPGTGAITVPETPAKRPPGIAPSRTRAKTHGLGASELSKKVLLEQFAPASVVVNYAGMIQYIHGPIRNYLDFPSGEPDLDVGAMALGGLKAKVRRALHEARSGSDTVSLVAPRIFRGDTYVAVRIRVQPLPVTTGQDPLLLISFLDEPIAEDEPGEADQNGQKAGEALPESDTFDRNLALELQATREDLQSTIEELESANEELKASNEEVMSMNEELQSTNEELETSREELQSLNEELSTVNNQLHDKVGELEATTNDLTNLLSSTEMATLFLDSDLCIRRFTPATTRLMNVIDADIGRPISDLSSHVHDSELVDDAREVLDRLAPVEREVKNGGGHWYMRRVMPFRTAENKIEGVVVTFSDVTSVKESANRLEYRERQQAAVAQLGRDALASTDLSGFFQFTIQVVAETLQAELAKVLRLESGQKTLKLIAGTGWREGLTGKATVPAGINSQAGFTLHSAGPVIVSDLRKEKRFSAPRLLKQHDVVSGLSVIIGPEEAPWGVLGVHNRSPVEYNVDDANFVSAVANLLWQAIQRKAVEDELRDSEERLAAAARLAGFGVYHVDVDNNVVTWSSELHEIFGLDADDPATVDFSESHYLVHEDDHEQFHEKFQAALNPKGSGDFEDEHRIIRRDGDIRWVLARGRTIFSGLGRARRPVRIAGFILDITERRHHSQELEEAKRSAEAANDAKSMFLANMSHEIRTPMTAILGYAELLDARIDDEELSACIRTIRANGAYLTDILNDILDLSRIESGKLKLQLTDCSLIEILADVRSLMAIRASEKKLTLTLDFEGDIPAVIQSDPKVIRQVLVNLIGNGVKFTDRGGIRVVTRCLQEQNLIEMSVTDTGIGISEQDLDLIFSPFEQVEDTFKREREGSGLGLAISRRLVDLLDGELALESVLGEGSTFTFRFPTGPLQDADWISPDPAQLDSASAPDPAKEMPRLSARVLVAEDRPEIRALVTEHLTSAGAEVEIAADGAAAVKKVVDRQKAGEKGFDVVLIDLHMPVMSGFEAALQLRSSGFHGPIIALTANVLPRDRERCLASGCDDILPKPIDKFRLLTAISRHLEEKEDCGAIKVLLVDDHEDTCRAQQQVLEMRGFTVEVATSGKQALERVKTFVPTVALIDLTLGDTTGGELLTRLRALPALENCRFIVLSGYAEENLDWKEMGFDDYLQKPAETDELEQVVRRSR